MELSDKQLEINRKAILKLLISTQRTGIESVIDYLYSSGFFIVPSSFNRHHCWKGGLAQHSLSVCNKALSCNIELSKDSVILCALLHDICKASQLYYDEHGNLKKRETYIKGHGLRSIKLLDMLGLKLNIEERRAIRWHMGGHHANGDEISDLELAKKSKLWEVICNADKFDANSRQK